MNICVGARDSKVPPLEVWGTWSIHRLGCQQTITFLTFLFPSLLSQQNKLTFFFLRVPGIKDACSDITWIMKWHQSEVIQRFLGSPQGCFQDLGGALDHLHQVVVHGARHVKDEGQRGCPLRDGLFVGCRGPSVLPGAQSHWQRQAEPQQTAAHLGAKTLRHKSSCSGRAVRQRASRCCAGRIRVLALASLRTSRCSLSPPLWTKCTQLQVSSACCLRRRESFPACHAKTTSQLGRLSTLDCAALIGWQLFGDVRRPRT